MLQQQWVNNNNNNKAAGNSVEGSGRADLATFSPKAAHTQYEPDGLLLAQGNMWEKRRLCQTWQGAPMWSAGHGSWEGLLGVQR